MDRLLTATCWCFTLMLASTEIANMKLSPTRKDSASSIRASSHHRMSSRGTDCPPDDMWCLLDELEGSVQLVGGGGGGSSGRLEVFHLYGYGSVCDDGFSHVAATVACRELGFTRGIRTNEFGPGSGLIWLDSVVCSGDESLLKDCAHGAWGEHDCTHAEDVGLHCYHDAYIPQGGDMRLVGGASVSSGRVQVYHDGRWGGVCGTRFFANEAGVVCRALGYDFGEAVAPEDNTTRDFGPILLDSVECTGQEHSLQDCSHSRWGLADCHHRDGAVITCY